MTNVYVLIDPVSNEVRYVGITRKRLIDRLRAHRYEARTSAMSHLYKSRWIRSLELRGFQPEIALVQALPDREARTAERYWIAYFRTLGCPLTNTAQGGEGGSSHFSPEGLLGRVRAAEKLLGQKRTAEQRARMSKSAQGKVIGIETRARMSESHTGLKRSLAHRQAIAEGQRRAWERRRETV